MVAVVRLSYALRSSWHRSNQPVHFTQAIRTDDGNSNQHQFRLPTIPRVTLFCCVRRSGSHLEENLGKLVLEVFEYRLALDLFEGPLSLVVF